MFGQSASRYSCSNCRQPISDGPRWRCQGPCQNYDLCQRCYTYRGDWIGPHNQYHFHTLFVNGDQPGSFFCDVCRAPITSGRRFHCQQCPDYDECDKCHSAPNTRLMGPGPAHVPQHAMQVFWEPGSRPGEFVCDHCKTTIHGLRWNCTSPTCSEFDLCDTCYRQGNTGFASHNVQHHMRLFAEPGSFSLPLTPSAPATTVPTPQPPPPVPHYSPSPAIPAPNPGNPFPNPGFPNPGFPNPVLYQQPTPPHVHMASGGGGNGYPGTPSSNPPQLVCGTTGSQPFLPPQGMGCAPINPVNQRPPPTFGSSSMNPPPNSGVFGGGSGYSSSSSNPPPPTGFA